MTQQLLWLDVLLLTVALISLLFGIFSLIRRKQLKELLEICISEKDALQDLTEELNGKVAEADKRYDALVKKTDAEKKELLTDKLTNLSNQRAFTQWLDNVTATIRKEENIAILHADIDDFKLVNDDLGHAYGDELLIDVAHRLVQAVGEDDFLARTEGDDFMMITQNLENPADYEDKIKKIRTLMNYPFQLGGREISVSLSIGICFAPQDGRDTQTLMRNSDIAMRQAKKIGKNTYCYYDQRLEEESTSTMEKQAKLRSAIEQNELEVWYAPVISLYHEEEQAVDGEPGRVVGYEAKLFWNRPDQGMVDFTRYEAVADYSGLIVQIGASLLHSACHQWKLWAAEGHGALRIICKIYKRQIRDENFIPQMKATLEEFDMDPKRLILEIDEDLLLDEVDRTAAVIARLSQLGITVALNQFGAQYGALNYVKMLPVQMVKLSKSLVFAAMADDDSQRMLSGLMEVMKALHLSVIVDGVDEVEQEDVLKKLGIETVEGLLYGEPLPPEKIAL